MEMSLLELMDAVGDMVGVGGRVRVGCGCGAGIVGVMLDMGDWS